ncbi:MAG: hypothetical protein M3268_08565 [Acidobacteriota bacterium]|nr:hypothetical protein [Acidobacteriota bacterium]
MYKASNSFSEHLYRSFIAVYGPFLSFAGLALAVIVFYVVPGTNTVLLRNVIVGSLVCLYVTLILLHAAWSAFQSEQQILPGVIFAKPAPGEFQPAIALLVLEPSVLFSYDSVVTVYYTQDDIELIVGLGRIINIQDNKKIQVLVERVGIEYEQLWRAITQNDISKLRSLRVKPTVSSIAMEVLRDERSSRETFQE